MKRIRLWITFGLLALLTLMGGLLQVQAGERSPELTVYNQGLALVRDPRTLTLQEGLNQVAISDVAAQIDPTSVHFRSLTDPAGTTVLEQNFEYDLVGSSRLLEKYIDQPIEVVMQDGSTYTGRLLSGAGDLILQGEDGGVTVLQRDQIRTFSFPALPEGLITRPTLVWLVDASTAGTHDVEITYLTRGISWRADYVILLAADETRMDLNGWVTLDNRSGATYKDARLKLVAGDVNVVEQFQRAVKREVAMARPAEAPQVEARPFFEYHLYEVKRPVTVRDNQTKQIEFVQGTDIPVQKVFVYESSPGGYYRPSQPITDPGFGTYGDTKVAVMLEFTTGPESNLDSELPRGIVRVYKADVDGAPLLVGEDTIDHTPKGEQVRLRLGNAFDIVGERRQTDFKKLGDRALQESFEITLRNHKSEDVEVQVIEHLQRWSEWEIVEASPAEYVKLDAQTIRWSVAIPANGERKVTYTVLYRW